MHCQWFDPDQNETCDEIATHTTCVIKDGSVCEKHKCRCSKTISMKRRLKYLVDIAYVYGYRQAEFDDGCYGVEVEKSNDELKKHFDKFLEDFG